MGCLVYLYAVSRSRKLFLSTEEADFLRSSSTRCSFLLACLAYCYSWVSAAFYLPLFIRLLKQLC